MRRRRRLRKKLHRRFLTTVCASIVSSDDELRQALLASEPGTLFKIDGASSQGIGKLMRHWDLVYWVTVVHRFSPTMAIVAYRAEQFPTVGDEAVIFALNDLA